MSRILAKILGISVLITGIILRAYPCAAERTDLSSVSKSGIDSFRFARLTQAQGMTSHKPTSRYLS